jgi:hypothetical protein
MKEKEENKKKKKKKRKKKRKKKKKKKKKKKEGCNQRFHSHNNKKTYKPVNQYFHGMVILLTHVRACAGACLEVDSFQDCQ